MILKVCGYNIIINMCGIFSYIARLGIDDALMLQLVKNLNYSKSRGPDNSQYGLESKKIFLGFHRLCINDFSDKGNQPIIHPDDFNLRLICNGEIYNHRALIDKYKFNCASGSDCEVIIHLYKKFGFLETIKQLDGVFACVIVDLETDVIYAARDRIGVRSMYYGYDNDGYGFCSELKSIDKLFNSIEQFKPGHIWDSTTKEYYKYYDIHDVYNKNVIKYDDALVKTKLLFEEAVKKRLMSDREIGCLLSGGLDSSLVAGILNKYYTKSKLKTFSIGLENSPDIKYAKKVADYLGTDHTEFIVSEQTMIGAIKSTIYQIESYDITTVRASVPMFLLSKYIKDTTDIAVIYSGEGSDEASGSYLYFHNAPDPKSFKEETLRLIHDLPYFDVLRCDKTTAGSGLEVRVPFLDTDFLEMYMNIESDLKMPGKNKIEKYLLRKAFSEDKLIPDEVLWRVKEGMSDGVSSHKRGWFEIIQEFVDTIYTDSDFEKLSKKYKHNVPKFKEALYYREIFEDLFENRGELLPYYWLPKWSGDMVEPSARALGGVYNAGD